MKVRQFQHQVLQPVENFEKGVIIT